MILNRIGNKKRLAPKIIRLFPPEAQYLFVDLFFGAGGLFFQKPLAKYNWVNDADKDVFNLFQMVMHRKEELEQALYQLPLHEELFNHWKTHKETDPILKAIRFLMLSNFSLTGKGCTMALLHSQISHKQKLIGLLDATNEYLQNCMFRSKDFRDFLKDIKHGEKHIPLRKRFLFADPPYLDSVNSYDTEKWILKDAEDLFEMSVNSGMKFGITEKPHPAILELAEYYHLFVNPLGKSRAIGGSMDEVLITNYQVQEKYVQGEISFN